MATDVVRLWHIRARRSRRAARILRSSLAQMCRGHMMACLAKWASAVPNADVTAAGSSSIDQVREHDDSEVPNEVKISQSLKQLSPNPGGDEPARTGWVPVNSSPPPAPPPMSASSPMAAALKQLELLAS